MVIHSAASKAQFSTDRMGKVTLASGDHLFAGLNCFASGQEHKAHTHPDQDKLYVVIEGTGEASVAQESKVVRAGDLILARAGVPHSMRNPGPEPLVVLVVLSPPPR